MVGSTPVISEMTPAQNVKTIFWTANTSVSGCVDFSAYSKVKYCFAQTSGTSSRGMYVVSGGADTAGYVQFIRSGVAGAGGIGAATALSGWAVVEE